MRAFLPKAFNYLHTRMAADFVGTDEQTVWLDIGDDTWTKIAVLQSRVRPQQVALGGLNTLATDTLVLFVKKTDWPAVKLNDCFLLGPQSAAAPTLPDTDVCEKYQITAAPRNPVTDWLRIEAQKQS